MNNALHIKENNEHDFDFWPHLARFLWSREISWLPLRSLYASDPNTAESPLQWICVHNISSSVEPTNIQVTWRNVEQNTRQHTNTLNAWCVPRTVSAWICGVEKVLQTHKAITKLQSSRSTTFICAKYHGTDTIFWVVSHAFTPEYTNRSRLNVGSLFTISSVVRWIAMGTRIKAYARWHSSVCRGVVEY